MSAADRLRKDAEELFRLAKLSESENVRRIISSEAEKLKQLAEVEAKSTASHTADQKSSHVGRPTIYVSKIINYAWDQSDKFLKIYVTLNGVHNFPPENVTSEFGPRSCEMRAIGTDKENVLTIKNLLHDIVPSGSYHKVKSDMVVLYLKKATDDHWGYVTEIEKKAKEPKTPKFDKDEDPQQSLMNLMKQMYEEGDDNMKRTIAKAWTEARDKTPGDMGRDVDI